MNGDTRARVLVVEDDRQTARELKRILVGKFPAGVELADDCAAARKKLAAGDFDIITLDFDLLESDGLELLEEITGPGGQPEVIMLTGSNAGETASHALGKRASGFVAKDGLLPEKLMEAMDRALTRVTLKRAEGALLESEDHFRALVEQSADIIAVFDSGANLRYASPSLERVLGYEPDEMVGTSVFDLIHPDDLQTILEVHGRAMEDPAATSYVESRLRHKDGNWVVLDAIGKGFINDAGEPGTFVYARDITDRKRMEEELRASEETAQALLNGTTDSAMLQDVDGTVLAINEMCARRLGTSADEIVGKKSHDLLPGELTDARDSRVKEAISTGKTLRFEDERNGMNFDHIVSPILDAGGNVVRVAVFSRDITDRKRDEDELKRLNRELEGYAHTVSHDLISPLTAIKLANETLRRLLSGTQAADPVEIRRYGEVIKTSVEKAEALIEDLLALAKAGQEPEEISEVDVNKVVKAILQEHAESIDGKGIRVRVDDDLGSLCANPTHVYQLFSNLIGNAIEHNDSSEPVIEVRRLDGGNGRRYLVKDNGSGISAGKTESIFLPFVKGKNGKTGIGLATVEKIIKVYDGWIKAYNDNGACFEFLVRDRAAG